MAYLIPRYPKKAPVTAGDTLNWQVRFSVPVRGRTWVATVREYIGGPTIAAFTITDDPVDSHKIWLYMADTDSARLRPGMSFDLRETAPGDRTYFIVQSLNVNRSYSYAPGTTTP